MEIFENLSASSRLESADLDSYSRVIRDVTESLEPAFRAGRHQVRAVAGGGS